MSTWINETTVLESGVIWKYKFGNTQSMYNTEGNKSMWKHGLVIIDKGRKCILEQANMRKLEK